MSVDRLVIDVNKFINAGLSLDMHFILLCILNNAQHTLEEYVNKCGSIGRPAFDTLVERDYIEPIDSPITFAKLKLTNKGKKYITNEDLDHPKFFKELKLTYPSKVKVGKSYRRLHQDLESCERKYKNLITSEEMHRNILKCVELYIKELKDTNRLEYIQMMSTWINQKNYEVYLEEAIKSEILEEDEGYNIV